MTGIETLIMGATRLLVLPLKMLVVVIVSAVGRKMHDKEKIDFKGMVKNIFLSTIALVVVFYGLKQFTTWSETTCLMFGGIAGFTQQEILGLFIRVAKNPKEGIDIVRGAIGKKEVEEEEYEDK
tara:strand:- start:1225 stop:1596 length:372 start_codon:yes stop_codon:yes gene_type:complete